MTTYEKEQLISAMYRMILVNDSRQRLNFLEDKIGYEDHVSKLFPVGAIDMITKTIREFEVEHEDA